jgi:D-serine deaminase-like pyridoxal phosphate-dependent protein
MSKTVRITQPTLLLDEETARSNIARMAGKARASGIRFRPHFKTHQSAEVGEWFRDYGVEAITVSSLAMARYFADHGWGDITLAVPVNLRELEEIDQLAGRVKLGLLADSEESLRALGNALSHPADLWIEIDPGYGRTGIPLENVDAVRQLARVASESRWLRLQGLLTHAGQTYQVPSVDEIRAIHSGTTQRLGALRDQLAGSGTHHRLSVGDTPGCSVTDRLEGVDEIRPGNFVFHDLMQFNLGVCTAADIALTVACPVIGVYPLRQRIAIYGGTVHLGREPLAATRGRVIYGLALPEDESPADDFRGAAKLTGLTQEHGMLEAHEKMVSQVRPGDLLHVYPTHSCITASLHNRYLTGTGKEIPRLAAGHDRGGGP